MYLDYWVCISREAICSGTYLLLVMFVFSSVAYLICVVVCSDIWKSEDVCCTCITWLLLLRFRSFESSFFFDAACTMFILLLNLQPKNNAGRADRLMFFTDISAVCRGGHLQLTKSIERNASQLRSKLVISRATILYGFPNISLSSCCRDTWCQVSRPLSWPSPLATYSSSPFLCSPRWNHSHRHRRRALSAPFRRTLDRWGSRTRGAVRCNRHSIGRSGSRGA